MSWRDRTVIRVLLIVARMLAGTNLELAREIKDLANHIAVNKDEAAI